MTSGRRSLSVTSAARRTRSDASPWRIARNVAASQGAIDHPVRHERATRDARGLVVVVVAVRREPEHPADVVGKRGLGGRRDDEVGLDLGLPESLEKTDRVVEAVARGDADDDASGARHVPIVVPARRRTRRAAVGPRPEGVEAWRTSSSDAGGVASATADRARPFGTECHPHVPGPPGRAQRPHTLIGRTLRRCYVFSLPERLQCRLRALSSVGRAPARQAGGHWFEPSSAHSGKPWKRGLFVCSCSDTAWSDRRYPGLGSTNENEPLSRPEQPYDLGAGCLSPHGCWPESLTPILSRWGIPAPRGQGSAWGPRWRRQAGPSTTPSIAPQPA